MIETEDSLQDGEMLAFEQDGDHVLLCKVRGEYHAISNICSHARVMLSMGKLRGTSVTCPLHGARFDVTTGKCLSGPAMMDIASFPVSVDNSKVIISTS